MIIIYFFAIQQNKKYPYPTFAQKKIMHKSSIQIDVHLDNEKVPQQINWQAQDSTADMQQKAKAMMLAFWDGTDKSALRIDLWTKEMMVDEMADFFYQTLMGMADSFNRATKNNELTLEMKTFAKDFYKKFRDQQDKENKLS
jgi:gliding motility-associated protein GldC